MKNTLKGLALLVAVLGHFSVKAQCLQIESILVDACNTGVNEYDNEMVRFRTGSTAIPLNQLSIASAPASGVFVNNAWPTTTQSWHGLVQDATTATAVTNLNATVQGCGYIIEPPGGVIPANVLVILVSSPLVSTTTNSFANLNDTVYMIFQGYGASSGQFGNCCGAGSRSLTLIDNLSGCRDTVSYQPSLIVGGNGGAVDYDDAGNPTYVNRGCQGAFIPLSVDAGTNQTVCFNDSVTLTATVSGTYSGLQWSLANAANGSFSAADSVITEFIPAAGAVSPVKAYVTITSSCGSFTTDSLLIAVTPAPNPAISSSNGAAICSGSSTTLSVSQQAGVTYSWNPGSGSGASVSVSPTASTNYTVTAVNNCTSTSATFSVTVNPLPTITANVSMATICAGTADTLTAGGTITTYTWSPGGQNTATVTVTPSGAGVQTYTLSGSDGTCNNSTTVSITVNALPAVPAPAAAAVCEGQALNLNANTSAASYSWTGPNSFASNSQNPSIPNATSVNAGTYTLTVYDGNCTSTPGTVTANVNPLPTVNSMNNWIVCSGNPVTAINFTASPGATVGWTNDNMQIGLAANGIGNIPSYTPSVTTQQVGSILVYPTYTATGCVGSPIAFSITVNPLPVMDSTNKIITAASCGMSDGAINGITATGAPVVQYSWDNGLTFSSSSGNSGLAAGTYTLEVKDGNGCISSASFVVPAGNLPPAPSASSANYCQGQNITPLTATGSGGTLNWYTDAGLTQLAGTGSSFTPSPLPTVTTTYYVVESNGSCTGTARPVTIAINPNPSAPIATGSAYCAGQTAGALTASSPGNTLNWYSNPTLTNLIGTGNSFLPVPSPTATTTYYVAATSPAGCTGGTTQVMITIRPNPVISGTAVADTAKCGFNTGGINGLTVSSGTPAYTYQWTNTATGLVAGTQLNLTNVGAGTYSLVVTDVNSCSASSAATYTVIATPAPTAAFTQDITQGVAPVTVNFTNNSTGATAYSWNFGTAGISTQQNPSVTYTATGNYMVMLIAKNGVCTDTTYSFVIVDENVNIIVPNIFSPNGDNTNDNFFITTNGIKSLQCLIYNRWGTKVFTLSAPDQKWNGKMENGNAAAEGTYYFMLEATGYDNKVYKQQGVLTLVQ